MFYGLLGFEQGAIIVGGASIWHWIVVLLFIPLLVFQVLFVLRARQFLQAAAPAERFWNPNFVWGCIVPSLTVIWVPLTVFSLERTARRDNRLHKALGDRLLKACGWFLKYGFLTILLLIFLESFLGLTLSPVAGDIVRWVLALVTIATIGSVIPYTIRLKRHLPAEASDAPTRHPQAAEQAGDVFSMVERLGHLRDKGLLSAEEFEGKKRELLTRI
ncbi:SHOCT domain-containing protein [Microvirga mediterraneensis]|nr:SHOCT domain-containing protein [Microvirga mediterraneensis]